MNSALILNNFNVMLMSKWQRECEKYFFIEDITTNLYEAIKGYYYKNDVNLSFQVALV